ncbi:MAG: sensor histidine kinase [Flavobacteriales bacterium]
MYKSNKRKIVFSVLRHLVFWLGFIFLNWGIADLSENFIDYLINRKVFLVIYISIFYMHYRLLVYSIQIRKLKFVSVLIITFVATLIYAVLFETVMHFGTDRLNKYDLKTTILLDTYFLGFMVFGSSLYYFIKDHLINKQKIKDLELQFLKDQIKPHYFYNELNSLLGLITKGEIELSKDYIKNLSEYLVYSLKNDMNEKVLLKDEINGLFSLLDNLEYRINENSNIDYSIKGQIDDLKIHPLILMTFVENAIKHSGIETSNSGFINLECNISDNEIHFELKNSIPNIKAQDLPSTKLGLQNVKKRLELQYHSRFDLKISTLEQVFIVELKIKLNE